MSCSRRPATGTSFRSDTGLTRIALFEEALSNARTSFAAWPGERVETDALLMPASAAPAAVTAPVIEEAVVATLSSEPFVSASALGAALLAVIVLTAGSCDVTSLLAITLFR
jgi:hypothetical protein